MPIKVSHSLFAGAVAISLAVSVVLPAAAQMGTKETQGTMGGVLLGGILGGVIGGGGASSVIGAISGAAVGGLIGNRVGASLDQQDRAALSRATRAAFVSGHSQRFARRAGAHGSVTVVSSTNEGGKPCRTVSQEVVLKDGSTLSDTVSACRGPHGWQV